MTRAIFFVFFSRRGQQKCSFLSSSRFMHCVFMCSFIFVYCALNVCCSAEVSSGKIP